MLFVEVNSILDDRNNKRKSHHRYVLYCAWSFDWPINSLPCLVSWLLTSRRLLLCANCIWIDLQMTVDWRWLVDSEWNVLHSSLHWLTETVKTCIDKDKDFFSISVILIWIISSSLRHEVQHLNRFIFVSYSSFNFSVKMSFYRDSHRGFDRDRERKSWRDEQFQDLSSSKLLDSTIDSINIKTLLTEKNAFTIKNVEYVASYNWISMRSSVILMSDQSLSLQ